MRPRLCRLGGEIADGVLLNWMLPDGAARAREWLSEGAAAAGREAPVVASYVRVAVGPGAQERLDAVEGRYRTLTPGQAAHFAALDVPLGTVGVAERDAARAWTSGSRRTTARSTSPSPACSPSPRRPRSTRRRGRMPRRPAKFIAHVPHHRLHRRRPAAR